MEDEPEPVGWLYTTSDNGRTRQWCEIDTPWPPELEPGEKLIRKEPLYLGGIMSTHDVPGAKTANRDILAMGCWAEHDDGSLIFVESVEGGRVVFSVFDVAKDPKVEYRTAMPEQAFKDLFSYGDAYTDDDLIWTWHDKTPFPWERIMGDFPEGQRPANAEEVLNAAERVAASLKLRAGEVRAREVGGTAQRGATTLMERIGNAISALKK